MIFWTIYWSVLVVYFVCVVVFALGWKLIPDLTFKENKNCSEFTFISVVIAFRNESANLDGIIKSLKQLEYPKNYYEVILVDDHSNDGSFEKAGILCSQAENFRLVQLESNLKGKKAALQHGVEIAHGEICAFTDADCLVSNGWLNEINSFYLSNKKPDLIIGIVDLFPARTILCKIFRIEFLSLVLAQAGLASLKKPVMCNGANLSVKRSSFLNNLSPQNHIASGDDVFLLHQFKKEGKSILVLKSQQHVVYTSPPKSLLDFIRQRVRWGSKTPYYTDSDTILLALLILGVNLFLIAGFVAGIAKMSVLPLLAGLFVKISADMLLFFAGNKFFKFNFQLLLIPIIDVLYPFYILFTSILIIKKPFDWKGRSIK